MGLQVSSGLLNSSGEKTQGALNEDENSRKECGIPTQLGQRLAEHQYFSEPQGPKTPEQVTLTRSLRSFALLKMHHSSC